MSDRKPLTSFTHHRVDRVLTVSVTEYYGRVTVIPQCALSRKFAELLGQKTLTEEDVGKIRELGYEVKVKTREL